MNYTYSDGSTPVGLDVGTSRIVAAWPVDHGYRFTSQLNSFVALPNSRMTEGVLRKERIPHTVRGSEIIVHGNESERFADLLGAELRRPMTKGFLNPAEPDSMPIMQHLLLQLLGTAAHARQKLFFSVPAPPIGAHDSLTYHEATLRQILGELGYEARPLNEGLAVIYSELESSNYTGIGISFGGGLCNVCMSYLAVPVIQFSVPKGGDFIDTNAAAVTGELVNRIRMVKEDGFFFNPISPDKAHQVLSVYYDDVIQTLVQTMRDVFQQAKSLPRLGRPVPLVLSGGGVLAGGFRERFEQALRQNDFPVPVSEVRLAAEPLHATARGAVIAALSEM
ncbi:MAG: hypothetical protein INH43_23530 [Acidobacteriaceae bacterium]|jgi:hypothetical protein|nr:hypothetical protein [Acidobacteriaceae bacterium]